LARYDKSVSEEELRAAINDRYGKWAVLRGVWRVESEGFVIQLATVNKEMGRDSNEEVGTKHVIYIALKGECNVQQ
jgi:hypothetical protein